MAAYLGRVAPRYIVLQRYNGTASRAGARRIPLRRRQWKRCFATTITTRRSVTSSCIVGKATEAALLCRPPRKRDRRPAVAPILEQAAEPEPQEIDEELDAGRRAHMVSPSDRMRANTSSRARGHPCNAP